MSRMHFPTFVSRVPVAHVRGRRGFAGPTWNDLRVLLALLEQRQPTRCLEIGVHEGHTAALLLEHGKSITEYIGIDCSPRDPGRLVPIEAGVHAKHDPRFRAVVAAGGTRGMVPDDIEGVFKWIWIDSDHRYHAAAYDTAFAEALLDPAGGIILWHDYGVPSQFQPGGPTFGVKQFIDERNRQLWRTSRVTTFVDPPHNSSIAFEIVPPR